jgi:hypothetical protein
VIPLLKKASHIAGTRMRFANSYGASRKTSMKRTRLALTLALPTAAMTLALAGLARAETAASTAAEPPSGKGVVGVCVRWGNDDSHPSDVVVVEPSGDPALDAVIPNTLRGMPWEKPDNYDGEWVALSVGVAGSQPSTKLPSCDALAAEDANVPSRPLATGKLISA